MPLVRDGQILPGGGKPIVEGAAVYRGPDNGAKLNTGQVTATANLAFVALEVGVDFGQFANMTKELGAAARELVVGEGVTVKRDIDSEGRQDHQ